MNKGVSSFLEYLTAVIRSKETPGEKCCFITLDESLLKIRDKLQDKFGVDIKGIADLDKIVNTQEAPNYIN
jgi:hypothetical protein